MRTTVLLCEALWMMERSRDFAVDLGARIRKLRKLHDIKQMEFAEVLGLANSGVSGIELGTRNVTASLLVEIAAYFEITTDALLGLQPLPPYVGIREEDYRRFVLPYQEEGMTILALSEREGRKYHEVRDILLKADVVMNRGPRRQKTRPGEPG